MKNFTPSKLAFIFIFLLLVAACAEDDAITQTSEIITEVSRQQSTYLGRPATILQLDIADDGLATRSVHIRMVKPEEASQGALVLSTGGFGTQFYGIGFETNTTLDFALKNGLETFEIKWLGDSGWGTGVAGVGYPAAVKAYGAIVRWLRQNEMTNSKKVIAHGGSGGSFQIAYGLARFNLEEVVDYAILIAGPPTSDLQQAIYGDKRLKSYWPDGLAGFRLTDYIHGWEKNGDHCQNRGVTPPPFVLEALNQSSLLSTIVPPDLNYRTEVIFVNTNDVTNADGQGRLYYEAIQSEKQWHYLPSENSHDVAGITAGGTKIRTVLSGLL